MLLFHDKENRGLVSFFQLMLSEKNNTVFSCNSNTLYESQALISVRFSFHVSHHLDDFELCFEAQGAASPAMLEQGAQDSCRVPEGQGTGAG